MIWKDADSVRVNAVNTMMTAMLCCCATDAVKMKEVQAAAEMKDAAARTANVEITITDAEIMTADVAVTTPADAAVTATVSVSSSTAATAAVSENERLTEYYRHNL